MDKGDAGVRLTQDNMLIEIDVPIAMDDGVVLRADIFRPVEAGNYPVIISYGPYGKGLPFQTGYKTAWDIMACEHPDAVAGTSSKYANWEVVDPEKWVPDGYAVVRVDSRGAGRSPGYLDHHSRRETQDFYDCIEWAGAQPWSNGKVGLNGISYYATNQWRVAGWPRRILLRSASGKAMPTATATPRITAASPAPSRRTGRKCRSNRCSTDAATTVRARR